MASFCTFYSCFKMEDDQTWLMFTSLQRYQTQIQNAFTALTENVYKTKENLYSAIRIRYVVRAVDLWLVRL